MVIKGIDSGIGMAQAFPTPGAKATKAAPAAEEAGKFFGELVNKVNDMQNQTDKSISQLASGEVKGLHEVMIGLEKSSISFQFLTQVRNKAVEAYQEIMRMQV